MNSQSLLKTLMAAVAAFCALTAPTAEGTKASSKILIAFYSYSGNTRAAAQQIQGKVGGELYEIKPQKPYPANYKHCVAQAKKEILAGFTPPLADEISLEKYEIIFIGSPNWWGTMAPPVLSFIKLHDFSGKTIIPFFTHGSGGMQNCESDMIKYCETARAGKILKAAAFLGSSMKTPVPELVQWAENAVKAAGKKK